MSSASRNPANSAFESHDLAEAPGGALQRRTPIAGDRLAQSLVLVRPRPAVAPGGSADPRIRCVETPPGLAAEDVTLEKDKGPPVRQETVPGRLDDHY